MVIRKAVPADVGAILRLMRELAEHEGHSQYLQLTPELLARYCFTAPPRLEILVAVAGEEVVGYASYMMQLSAWAGRDYLFVDDVYVVSSQRGAGVGSLLMKAIAAVAIERDMEARWHVETGNAPALKFYRSLGAEMRSRFIAYWTREAMRSRA